MRESVENANGMYVQKELAVLSSMFRIVEINGCSKHYTDIEMPLARICQLAWSADLDILEDFEEYSAPDWFM